MSERITVFEKIPGTMPQTYILKTEDLNDPRLTKTEIETEGEMRDLLTRRGMGKTPLDVLFERAESPSSGGAPGNFLA